MNIQITQTQKNPEYKFEITIQENGTETRHSVTISKEYFEKLQTNKNPKEITHESFNFLLQRESKEQILSNFDITLISHYFPEFQSYIENWSRK
ncbi:hypothetical protein K0B04_03840 [Patescibacteria group bacterium]|nr:hypothetical protein [Patescibacteria group bacterium]